MNGNEKSTVEDEIDLISEKRKQAAAYAADLETIRINRWRPWDEWEQKVGGLNTVTQNLDTKQLKTGKVYVMTNLVGLETGTKPTTVTLGYVRTARFYVLTKQTPTNNNDSVDYVGQVILIEGDRIRCQFAGATAVDTIELFANGYEIMM